MNRRITATAILAVSLLAACGSGGETGSTTTGPGEITSSEPTPTTTTQPTTSTTSSEGDDSTETTMSIDPGLAPLITPAVADLSERLDVPESEIEVVSAELVTWPDTSLGCPQEGMQYAQVLTDGSVITLRHAGKDYPYHTGGSTYVPFLCENKAR